MHLAAASVCNLAQYCAMQQDWSNGIERQLAVNATIDARGKMA
jgi:hypothetical protein